MFRLAVAVIEGEESRIRESLEGEEGEGGGAGPRMGEKEKRTKEQKPQSRDWGRQNRWTVKTFGSQDKETQGWWDSDIFRP